MRPSPLERPAAFLPLCRAAQRLWGQVAAGGDQIEELLGLCEPRLGTAKRPAVTAEFRQRPRWSELSAGGGGRTKPSKPTPFPVLWL